MGHPVSVLYPQEFPWDVQFLQESLDLPRDPQISYVNPYAIAVDPMDVVCYRGDS